jgi:hypothetical protein
MTNGPGIDDDFLAIVPRDGDIYVLPRSEWPKFLEHATGHYQSKGVAYLPAIVPRSELLKDEFPTKPQFVNIAGHVFFARVMTAADDDRVRELVYASRRKA